MDKKAELTARRQPTHDSRDHSDHLPDDEDERVQFNFVSRMYKSPPAKLKEEDSLQVQGESTLVHEQQDVDALLVGDAPSARRSLAPLQISQKLKSAHPLVTPLPLAAALKSKDRMSTGEPVPQPQPQLKLKRLRTLDHRQISKNKPAKGNLDKPEKRVTHKEAKDPHHLAAGNRKREELLMAQIKRLDNNPKFQNNLKHRGSFIVPKLSKIEPISPAGPAAAPDPQKTPGEAPSSSSNRARSKSHIFPSSHFESIHQAEATLHVPKKKQLSAHVLSPQLARRELTKTGSDSKAIQKVLPMMSTISEGASERPGKEDSLMDDMLAGELPRLSTDGFKNKDKSKIKRMTHRDEKKAFLIYPENKLKGYWDLLMTLVLLVSCILTPVDIAFKQISDQSTAFVDFLIALDILFAFDIIIIFCTVYYDEEVQLVEDRKMIAQNYLRGWFTIDLFAIIPFDLMLDSTTEFNSIVRVTRVGRLYKLVKLTKLLRVLKIMRDKSKLLKQLNEFLKIGLGFERLFFFLIIFILMCHISACLWVTIAGLKNDKGFDGTWMDTFEGQETSTIYLTSFYWTVTTITTVGYGDISGTNNIERFYCSLMMLVGVFAFSFANGSLASIIQNYDQTNAQFQEKVVVLNKIYKDYCLPLDLYVRLKQSLAYENQKDIHDINRFVEDLPHKLRIEVSLYIYEERYNKLKIFRGQSAAFISWLCPLLRPQFFGDNQYIFMEGDDVNGIYFLISGKASFVLPSFDSTPFISINEGDSFGLIDIVGSSQTKDFDLEDWYENKNLLQRQFSISSIGNVELQTIALQDLFRLQQEFGETFNMMIESAVKTLRAAWIQKLDAMQKCNSQQQEGSSSSSFTDSSLAESMMSDQKKRTSKKKFFVNILDLDQIDEMGESESSFSSEAESVSCSEKSSSSSFSGRSSKAKKIVQTNSLVTPTSSRVSGSLRKSKTTMNKGSETKLDEVKKKNLLRASTKKVGPTGKEGQELPKSKSLKVIDKNELIGNQPLKDAKEIQEEGQLVLQKLEKNMDKKKGLQSQLLKRKTGIEESTKGSLFSKKSFFHSGGDPSEEEELQMVQRRSSNRPPSLSPKHGQVTTKRVHFSNKDLGRLSKSSSDTSSILTNSKANPVRIDIITGQTGQAEESFLSSPNRVDKPTPSPTSAQHIELLKEIPRMREEMESMRTCISDLKTVEEERKESQAKMESLLLEEIRSLRAKLDSVTS